MATSRGSALSSATIATSVGPASESMRTSPESCFFASVTNALPGPTMTSARGICCVPIASAATACAPPVLRIRVAPAMRAAAATSGNTEPSRRGGVATITSRTPASRATAAVMITVLGYAARPPGT